MWKWGLAGTGVVAMGTAVAYHGSYEQGEVYPLPEAVVYQKLVDMPLPPELDAAIRNEPGVDLDVDVTPGTGVSHTLRKNRTIIGRMDELVSNEGPAKTRVRVELTIGDLSAGSSQSREALVVKDLANEPAFKATMRIIFQEQVSSTLEGRPYDKAKMQREMQAFIAANPAMRVAFVQRLRAAEVAHEHEGYGPTEVMAHSDDEDYRNPRRDWVDRDVRAGQPMVSGGPMVDPVKDR